MGLIVWVAQEPAASELMLPTAACSQKLALIRLRLSFYRTVGYCKT